MFLNILNLIILVAIIILLVIDKIRRKPERLTELIKEKIAEEFKPIREEISSSAHRQVESFTKGMTEISSALKQVAEDTSRIGSFQELFKSPKLTGKWGEEELKHLLSEYPSSQWEWDHEFKSGDRVEALFLLPNGKKLPIDSKFTFDTYEQMRIAEDEESKSNLRKIFINRVQRQIDDISSKYILPSEGTTDLAIMYIPAESVYDEIGSYKEKDMFRYARSKKVILVSPNNFFLTISVLRFWIRDIQFSKKTQEIVKRFETVIKDAEKLEEDFKKLGKHLGDARSTYDNIDHRFELLTDRAQRAIELSEEEVKKLPQNNSAEQI